MHYLDTTVLGDLPVTICYVISKADPSSGIFHPYVSEWSIVTINGRPPHSRPDWLYTQIRSDDSDILAQCLTDWESNR